MRLDSVEILGFKSFCDRQEVSFDGGVTGIVGPNGCGKSNISDAINWVLGEQSVKSLRGTSMEDVIFAGSSARKAVGVCEVDLVLDAVLVQRQQLRRGVFTSVPELIETIDQYIGTHNKKPKPFIWTAKANDILEKVVRANRKLSSKQNATLH